MSVSAQAMPSEISCNNEIVTVPGRGRIDLVKKTVIVKVGFIQTMRITHIVLYSLEQWKLSDSFAPRLKVLRRQRTSTGCSALKVGVYAREYYAREL